MGIIIGIDASRNRSGGAVAHILGVLKNVDPYHYGISEVHLWSYKALLHKTPSYRWLIKHSPPELGKSLFHQIYWQYFSLPKEVLKNRCDILLNTDAGSVCPFSPAVTMSRDMLSYEPGEIERFNLFSKARMRLFLLRIMQNRSLRRSKGIIFLTNYAAKTIQQKTGPLEKFKIIPHGVGDNFRYPLAERNWPDESECKQLLYVSNAELYKHQWNVVSAVGKIKNLGFAVFLLLVGGGNGEPQQILHQEIMRTDPDGLLAKQVSFVKHEDIPGYLKKSDVFVFASSCENMPNTLLEAMACGIPIACSNRGPMPEILLDGGVYFDPEKPDEIAEAIIEILTNPILREKIRTRAQQLSKNYSWARCAKETFEFLCECVEQGEKSKPR